MDRTIETAEYRFNEKGHRHELLKDGEYKSLTGVTTVLGVIAKPALIQWAANQAIEHITKWLELKIEIQPKDVYPILEEAKKAHTKKKEAAGDWGTQVHADIEKFVKENIGYRIDQTEIQYSQVITPFIEWSKKHKVTFLESEKHVYSRTLWIGGILDLVLKMDGKTYIADVKTSSGIYDEHFFQMAAYDLCLEEMTGKAADGYLVINLRKDGKFDLKVAENRQINKDAFLAALTLYRIKESLN